MMPTQNRLLLGIMYHFVFYFEQLFSAASKLLIDKQPPKFIDHGYAKWFFNVIWLTPHPLNVHLTLTVATVEFAVSPKWK